MTVIFSVLRLLESITFYHATSKGFSVLLWFFRFSQGMRVFKRPSICLSVALFALVEVTAVGFDETSREPGIQPRSIEFIKAKDQLLYATQWERRVEAVGLRLFANHQPGAMPHEALIHVSIQGGGWVEKAQIVSTSGNPDVDATLLQIIYLAEPYPPFSDSMMSGVSLFQLVRRLKITADASRFFHIETPLPTDDDVRSRPEVLRIVQHSETLQRVAAGQTETIDSVAIRPRNKYITSDFPGKGPLSEYVTRWATKIEQAAKQELPDAVRRRKLVSNAVIDVAILPNGTLLDIVVRRSSGMSGIDDAARQIAINAAPFEALPKDASKQFDILHIVRTWHFSENGTLEIR